MGDPFYTKAISGAARAPCNIAGKDLLYSDNIDSLRTFLALVEVELNSLILLETTETVALDACVVYKYVLTFFGRHETITLGRVEPFYFAFHRNKNIFIKNKRERVLVVKIEPLLFL